MNQINESNQSSAIFRSVEELKVALDIPFSPEQCVAITAPLEPGVIVAGAGSGKTAVMAARVVWLVGTGQIRPDEVLGLTFTRKAAAELACRIRKALQQCGVINKDVDDAGEPFVATYDSFAGNLVAEHGLRIGIDQGSTMVTGASRFRLASNVVSQASGPFPALSRLRAASIVERVLNLDSELSSHLLEPSQLESHCREVNAALANAPLYRGKTYKSITDAYATVEERKELLTLVADYQRYKKERGYVEFSDQMALAARLARDVPAVSAAYRSQFKVVLLDEYQDTSNAQMLFLRNLFSGSDTAQGLGHAVTAVGDPFQGIYGWRGAAASNILTFDTDFPCADNSPAKRFSLSVNRRSGSDILEVANKLVKELREDPVIASKQAPAELTAPKGAGVGTIHVGVCSTWSQEIALVADEITAAHRDFLWKDIAVLSRGNKEISALYSALAARDIPCEIVGLGGLLLLPEIVDVVATLRIIDDASANADLIRLLTGARWSIGADDLAVLGRRAVALSRERKSNFGESVDFDQAVQEALSGSDEAEMACLIDAVADPGNISLSVEGRQRIAKFAQEIAMLREYRHLPVTDLVRRVVATLGLDVELAADPARANQQPRRQLYAFLDEVANYADSDPEATLAGLLTYFDAEIAYGTGLEQAAISESDSVKLLTIHRAKGLEWEVVFLPALVSGTFPNLTVTDNWVTNPAVVPAPLRGDAADIAQLTEVSDAGFKAYKEDLSDQAKRAEDRLAYVAVTRAKTKLVATGHRWRGQNKKPVEISAYFIKIQEKAHRVLCDIPPLADGEKNPEMVDPIPQPWPAPLDEDAVVRRVEAADMVRRYQKLLATGEDITAIAGLDLAAATRVAAWDQEIADLIAETQRQRRGIRSVTLPVSLSATQLIAAKNDAQRFALDIIRPIPRAPQREAAFGTHFHNWVERRFDQTPASLLEDEDELYPNIDVEDFNKLCERFENGLFGNRAPARVEQAFTLTLSQEGIAHTVRGRIDAVYRDGDDWLVVDWKTSKNQRADSLQLALYRLAWAELENIEISRVRAAFYYVRSDRLVEANELPDRAGLTKLILDLGENSRQDKNLEQA
ncbi:MAG: UvrD-helicase domain-containing protein [Propionibacteriaceae bacterium]